jgi:hypothetical protein
MSTNHPWQGHPSESEDTAAVAALLDRLGAFERSGIDDRALARIANATAPADRSLPMASSVRTAARKSSGDNSWGTPVRLAASVALILGVGAALLAVRSGRHTARTNVVDAPSVAMDSSLDVPALDAPALDVMDSYFASTHESTMSDLWDQALALEETVAQPWELESDEDGGAM